MQCIYRSAILLVFLSGIGSATTVRAELLVDPTGGMTLLNGSQGDDAVATINSGGSFGGLFFGASVGPITVAENGNLNFSGDDFFFPSALDDFPGVARISPLWDDVLMLDGANNEVIDHSVSGQYIGITWKNARLFNETVAGQPLPDTDRSFQALWFEAPTTIKGVQFNPNEIVFSYVGHVAGTSNFGPIFATTGLTDGVSRFTPLPGDADGFITENQSTLLAWEPGSYLVFRPVTTGSTTNYVASKEFATAVAEPSTVVAFSVLLCGVGFRYHHRMRRQRLSVHAG